MDTQCTNRVQSPTKHAPTILEIPVSSAGASPSIVASEEVNSATPCDGDRCLVDCSVQSHPPASERDATGSGSPTFAKQNVFSDTTPHTCYGCKKALGSSSLVKTPPNLFWHADCLFCCECRVSLSDGPSCHMKEGNTYCKRDYLKCVGIHCSKCQQKLQEDDSVMQANGQIFHKDCFTCSVCQGWLEPGEEAAIKEDGLYCGKHKDATASDGDSTKQENTKNEDKVSGKARVGKKPRQRTVLSEEQLQLLKYYYCNIDRKPSTPLKEEICKKTNLSMRVVRVWFQNKRCKEKKDRLRQDGWDLVTAQPDTLPSTAGPILFNPYLPHSSMLNGAPRMDGIAPESLYCNQPYAAVTATPPRHLQYATPVPQYPCPTSAPPMSLPSTAHALYYNMSHVPGGSFPISRCSLIEAGTVGPTSPYSVGDPPACPPIPQGVFTAASRQVHY